MDGVGVFNSKKVKIHIIIFNEHNQGTRNYDYYQISINKKHNEPWVNKKQNPSNIKKVIKYTGKVYCVEVLPSHIIYVRRKSENGTYRSSPLWSGNSAQKGTVGLILDEQDMPFSEDGIIPDIILNPHAIPSRMTISQMIESVLGKLGSTKGKFYDATPFEDFSIDKLQKAMEKIGFNPAGTEVLYNGMNGKELKVEIFIGPTYYQRLKHMVADKIHGRAYGPTTSITRQPIEGRSRQGGLRLGEMEAQCLMAHGVSGFLKERIFECSDEFYVFVCDDCGTVAIANEEENLFECRMCDNRLKFSKINMPYATKLLWFELHGMSINPRIFTKKKSEIKKII